MGFISLLKSVYIEAPVVDETVWHKRLRAPLFARTIGGGRIGAYGQIWRRKHCGIWEYRQDNETTEDYDDRVW